MSKLPLKMEDLDKIVCEEIGIKMEYNDISHDIEIEDIGNVLGIYNPVTILGDLPVILENYLSNDYTGCNSDKIAKLLSVIAGMNRYNPVERMLSYCEWDGKSRFSELYDALHIDDEFYQTLLRKGLIQCISLALFNSLKKPFGADGMLVFKGSQGIGKTSLVSFLGHDPKLYKLGAYINPSDKDSVIMATSAWITELGELETSLNKSDAERLKAFITQDIDQYRPAYGRTYQKCPRHTTFMATCNSAKFLNDVTGSRRFWVIPVDDIDLDALHKIDALQLWHEVAVLAKDDPQSFRLTAAERNELERRNRDFQKTVTAQDEVEDIIHDAENNPSEYKYVDCTITDFIMYHNALSRYSVKAVGAALDACDITQKRKRNGERVSRVRCLPMPKSYTAAVYSSSKNNKAFGDTIPF